MFHIQLAFNSVSWTEVVDLTGLIEIPADNLLPEVASLHVLDDGFEVSYD